MTPGAPDGDVVVGIRPEGLSIASSADRDGDCTGPIVEFVVANVEALGNENLVHGIMSGIDDADKPLDLPRTAERLTPSR